MKNLQWGLSAILVLAVVAVALTAIGGGTAYFYYKGKKADTQKKELAKLENLQPKPLTREPTSDLLRSSYWEAKSVIENKADLLFENATTDKPEFKINAVDPALRVQINTERQRVTELLKSWGDLVAQSSLNLDFDLKNISSKNLTAISLFLANINNILNDLSPNSSGLSPTELGHYQSAIISAQNEIQASAILSEIETNDPLTSEPTSNSGKPKLIEGPNNN